MSTLMLISLSVNIKSTFSLSLLPSIKQPFFLFRGIELSSMACLTLGVVGRPLLSYWISLLTWLLNFCLPCASLRARPGARCQNLEALQVCHDYSITALCVCLSACVSALSKHTAGSPSPNLFTQVRRVVCVCVCVFYHHGAHLSSLPSTNLEGRV